jgi:hypothetical protein
LSHFRAGNETIYDNGVISRNAKEGNIDNCLFSGAKYHVLRVIDPFPAPEKSDFTVMVSFPGAGNYVLTIMVFYRSLIFRGLRKIGRFFDVFCGMHPSGASSGSAAEQRKGEAHGASRGDANVFIYS